MLSSDKRSFITYPRQKLFEEDSRYVPRNATAPAATSNGEGGNALRLLRSCLGRLASFLGDFIKHDTEPRCITCQSPNPMEFKPTQHKNPKGDVVNGNASKMIRFKRGDLATSEASPTTLVSASLRDRVKHVEQFQDGGGLWQRGQRGETKRSQDEAHPLRWRKIHRGSEVTTLVPLLNGEKPRRSR